MSNDRGDWGDMGGGGWTPADQERQFARGVMTARELVRLLREIADPDDLVLLEAPGGQRVGLLSAHCDRRSEAFNPEEERCYVAEPPHKPAEDRVANRAVVLGTQRGDSDGY